MSSGGAGSLSSFVEVRHLHSVSVLAEVLNFTKAADRLNISQSALSKQVTELEERLGLTLFVRRKNRVIDLTDAGRAFLTEARMALLHTERAVHSARAIHHGCEGVLTIGHSAYADQAWLSALRAIHVPAFPNLRLRLTSLFPMELVPSVLSGELNLALVTGPPQDPQITSARFSTAPLYAVMLESHPSARKPAVSLRDLRKDAWVLFAKRVHPLAYDAIQDTARQMSITPKEIHEVITPADAFHHVADGIGVAVLTQPSATGSSADGIIVRPLVDESLLLDTSVVMRADDESPITNAFVMAFLRKFQHGKSEQMKLPIAAPESIFRRQRSA